ncbi:nucleotide disphospho-sugar-binding domain-containing protein [Nocardiopsis ganjiahuensis]|uniref:nucleotide disphospho-sugar-binding domain-containing protein n=1 Tax=Nocardiopsis ganjiahuensis TaxID=239984 RepID=UPI00034C8FCA|nr:nucleotide disphospho-sugar-binding domain-containing protein [Nocardiopsis ganjiahuensis]
MRIVIAAYADKAYFFSMVPTAWALRAAGHEVRIATQPAMAGTAAETGLTVVPVGADHSFADVLAYSRSHEDESFLDPFGEDADALTPEQLRQAYDLYVTWWWKLVNEPVVEDLVRFCGEWRPDLVLWEPHTFAGAIAAEACGAAHGRFLWGLDLPARLRGLYAERAAAESSPDPLTQWLEERAGAFGVEFSTDLLLGQFSVHQLPEALRWRKLESGTHLSVRPVPYGGTAVLPAWAREDAVGRRILVDWGSWDRRGDGVATLVDVVDASLLLGAEVVVLSPPSRTDGLPALPEGVRVVDSGASHMLMGTASLLVHGGGFDVACNALVEGVPQFVVVNSELIDAAPLARALREQGAARSLSPSEVLGTEADALLSGILADEALREGAARLRDGALRAPAPDRIVADLERIAHARGSLSA